MANRHCSLHKSESITVYCSSCRSITCFLCHNSYPENVDHVMRDVNEVADERRCYLDNVISSKLAEFQDAYDEMRQRQSDERSAPDELLRHIDTSADQLKSLIDQKQRELSSEVESWSTQRRQRINNECTAVEDQLTELHALLIRCDECKNKPSIDVLLECDRMDLSLECLASLTIDHKSLTGTMRHPLPHWKDFLQWNTTQLFADKMSEDAEDAVASANDTDDEDESHPETLQSWTAVENKLEPILTALMTAIDPHSGSSPEVEEQFTEARILLDALFQIVSGLEEQLKETRRRNRILRESLSETKQLLQAEQQRRSEASANDDPKKLEHHLAEVERIISEQDAESDRRKTGIAVNIAVIGKSGVGKSSFINAIRGLTADDDGAAPVGVTETTTEITPYTHPHHPDVTFWDLPGVGTDQFPQTEYLRLISVDRYDLFVIISATRFYEIDTWLVNEVSRRGKMFAFVRTKVDVDVRSNRKAHPQSHNEQAVVAEILASTKEHLNHTQQSSADVFLIDSYATRKYDFWHLADRLLHELPESKVSVTSTPERQPPQRRCVVS